MKIRPLRKIILALLKLGFKHDEIMAMPETQVEGYIDAYEELIAPQPKNKKYIVKRKK